MRAHSCTDHHFHPGGRQAARFSCRCKATDAPHLVPCFARITYARYARGKGGAIWGAPWLFADRTGHVSRHMVAFVVAWGGTTALDASERGLPQWLERLAQKSPGTAVPGPILSPES